MSVRTPVVSRISGALLICILASCKQPPSAPPQTSTRPQASTDVVARVGDQAITLKEVDDKWRELHPEEQMKAHEAVYSGRRSALDVIIGDAILGRAAKKRGVSVEQLLRQEIPKRAKPVSEADIEAFYKENKSQIGDRTLEDVRAAIMDLLQRRQREDARESLLAEVRKEAGETQIALDPPRQDVAIGATDPVRGPQSAPVTIVEFSDYQCPFCARVTPVLAKIRETYGDRVRIVWKDYPLEDIHLRAVELAQAARCAGDQGKYWEFHDRVFATQDAADTTKLEDFAKAIGIKAPGFVDCVKSKRHAKAVADAQEAGQRLGVDATPTLFINGRMIAGAHPFEVFARLIDDELARPRQ